VVGWLVDWLIGAARDFVSCAGGIEGRNEPGGAKNAAADSIDDPSTYVRGDRVKQKVYSRVSAVASDIKCCNTLLTQLTQLTQFEDNFCGTLLKHLIVLYRR
jgi:hypothetical protein